MLLKTIISCIIGLILGISYGIFMGKYILIKCKKGLNDIKFWIIFTMGLFMIAIISYIIETLFL